MAGAIEFTTKWKRKRSLAMAWIAYISFKLNWEKSAWPLSDPYTMSQAGERCSTLLRDGSTTNLLRVVH